jgi:hypothetical protein
MHHHDESLFGQLSTVLTFVTISLQQTDYSIQLFHLYISLEHIPYTFTQEDKGSYRW